MYRISFTIQGNLIDNTMQTYEKDERYHALLSHTCNNVYLVDLCRYVSTFCDMQDLGILYAFDLHLRRKFSSLYHSILYTNVQCTYIF